MKLNSTNMTTKEQGWVVDRTLLDRRRSSAGFTMLEVITGLAIMMLMIGGVYSIADGALDLGVQSSTARESAVREMNFTKVMRSTLARLGPDARVTLSPARLILYGETGILDVGGETVLADKVGFEFREDNAVWVSHFRDEVQVSDLRLMGDFTRFMWECQDPVSGNWLRAWDDKLFRPELIRLRTVRGELEHTEVFWIPSYGKEERQ